MPDSILRFNGTWRSYQKRILDDLDFHLRDDKLHVVAAPGAGKTTLGTAIIFGYRLLFQDFKSTCSFEKLSVLLQIISRKHGSTMVKLVVKITVNHRKLVGKITTAI